MPGKLVLLNPQVTPQEYYNANQQELGIVPDGTGLQILFKINGEYYLVAGPRSSAVLTVNGGSIENKQQPFLTQLQEELEEETFGKLQITKTEQGYQLVFKGNYHPLILKEEQTFLMHKPGTYAYVTFTAVCETLTLDQLNELATNLSPTANFWSKIGNYLFPHSRNAPKDVTFAAYWQSHKESREALIAELLKEYNNLIKSHALLIDPTDVFKKQSITDALNTLHEVTSYDELNTLFRHTVGRYSERAGYYVFKASDLLQATLESSKTVNDYTGKTVATGVFNKDAVSNVLPALGISVAQNSAASAPLQAPGNISPHSPLFKPASLPSSRVIPEQQNTFVSCT